MKLATVCAFLLSASALATPSPPKSQTQSVSYDGVKVLRIQLDDSTAKAAKVEALIKKLNLETWTDAVKPNHNVDVQVGSADLAKFQSGLAGIPYTTMHEDLGASIRAESETIPISALSKAVADDGKFGSLIVFVRRGGPG